VVDDLQIGGFASQAGTVVDDLAIDLASREVNETQCSASAQWDMHSPRSGGRSGTLRETGNDTNAEMNPWNGVIPQRCSFPEPLHWCMGYCAAGFAEASP